MNVQVKRQDVQAAEKPELKNQEQTIGKCATHVLPRIAPTAIAKSRIALPLVPTIDHGESGLLVAVHLPQ